LDEWTTVSRYEIVRRLGEGGDGSVYLARLMGPDDFEQRFVLKVPKDNAQAITNLKEEARLLLRLTHPNIVAVRDYGYTDPTRRVPVLVLEHGGIPLTQLLHSVGRIEPGLSIAIALQVCAALAYAHQFNVIHRDIKPDNILVSRVGQVRVIDWGIAKGEHRADKTAENRIKGTPTYLAPEMIRCEPLDARTDVWQVGILLYLMLTGFPPWTAKSEQALDKDKDAWKIELGGRIMHKRHPPIPAELTPANLVAVVDRCLEKDPRQRYASITELIRALYDVRLVPPHIANVEVGQQVCAAEESLTRNHAPDAHAVTVPIHAEDRAPAAYGAIQLAADPMDSSGNTPSTGSVSSATGHDVSTAIKVLEGRGSTRAPGASWERAEAEETEEFPAVWSQRRPWRAVVAVTVLVACVVGGLALRSWRLTLAPKTAAASSPEPIERGTRFSTADESNAAAGPARLPLPPALTALARESAPLQGAEALGSARKQSDVGEASGMPAPSAHGSSAPGRNTEGASGVIEEHPGDPVGSSVSSEEAPSKLRASLRVVVVPADAFVALDGRQPIPSPASFGDVRPGRHSLRTGLTRGSLTKEEHVKLNPGSNEVRIVLVDPFANQHRTK
jgi:serine/threonine protein kinase